MVRAVGVGARCGLSVFRCPKRVIGVWCLCLCSRDRPPNFLCRCPACPFVGKGTTLSNARRQVKGHALRAHEAIFRPERDTLQQLGPDELRSQLEVFRRGQRSAPRRRAAAARVAVGEGSPGARGLVPGASGDPLPGPSAGRPLEEELGPEPEVDLLPEDADTNKVVDASYQPPRGFSTQEMVDYLSDVAPMLRSSPAGDGAHSTWSDVDSVCDGRWPQGMPLPDLRASHVIVSGVVVRRSVTDAEFDAVTLLFLFRRWNACYCLIVNGIAV